jgi:enoyl-[acyl-carrier-protein] reductase (NADH)
MLWPWEKGRLEMLLENKNAIIYGGGGSIGGAVDSKFEDEAAFQGLIENLDQMRMTRRSPRLSEVAATAVFLASDGAGAITGTFVNVTSGIFPS